jgi:hypothetical protein
MPNAQIDKEASAVFAASLTGAHRRTLEAVFRHPSVHNLEWNDVVAMIDAIGESQEKPNGECVFQVAGQRHLMRKPHTKDLTSSDVTGLRHFLEQAGASREHPSQPPAHPGPAAPDLMIVVDHHGARIFQVEVTSDQSSEHVIRPYDPHHFLHHLTHKDQARERGQRSAEAPTYYESIANAVAAAGKILVVGHGAGHSNAAHHLFDWLRTHHSEIFARVVGEIATDLSAITTPQLLERARAAFRQ